MGTNLRLQWKYLQYFGSRWISSTSSKFSNDIIDPPDLNPSVPSCYKDRQGENVQRMKARLLYQSRKRGMLENGLLLSTFAAKFLPSMSEDQLHLYDKLINAPSNEWDLYYWASGTKPTPKEYQHEVMQMLKEHVQNSDRQCRVRQPDL